jgi:hypothetical protein
MVTKVVKDVKEQRKCARSKVPKGFFEIDKIVTHREKEGETGYSIRWKGYEQAIGVEVTKEEVAEFIVKGGKILNAKFVYKLEDAQDRVLLVLHYVDDLVLASKDHLLRDEFLKHMGITWKITSEDKNTGFANTLFAATDASFAMCPLTRKSHAGYVIFLNHGPISYKSKLQNIVTLSSAEAEFVALSDVTCEVKYLRELSRGLGYPQREATLVFEDNRAAILVAQNECSASGRMRHVDVKFRFVVEAVKNKEIRVRYIPTDLNFADCFTKSLTPKKHAEAVKAILGDKDAYRLTVAKVDQEDEDQETENVMILDFTW